MKKSKQKKKTEVLVKCMKGSLKGSSPFFYEGNFYINTMKVKDNLIIESQHQIKTNRIRTIHEVKDKNTGRIIKWCITLNKDEIKKWNYEE